MFLWLMFSTFFLMFFFLFNIFLMNIEMLNFKKFIFNIFIDMKINFFIFTIIFIFFLVIFFIKFYMKKEKIFSYFLILLFIFVMSMILLIFSKSLFLMFIGWEGLGSSSFLLICYYKNWESMNNSLITMFNNKMGDIFFLMFFSFFLFDMSFNYMILMNSFMLLFIIMTKSAQFPFMSWLPAAMSAPTPISSLVHSSTLVTAGILFMSKMMNIMSFKMSYFLFLISLLSMFFSSMFAILEKDFKKIVAFSTLSQISFMLLTFSLNLYYMCFFHLFIHAFFKSMLFFSVGNVLHNKNSNQDKRIYNKFLFSSYINFNIILIALLSMSGIFFLSGFFSKESIIENSLIKEYNLFLFFFLFVLMLTFMYSLKMFKVFFYFSKESLFKMETSQSYLINSLLSIFFSIFLGNWFLNNMVMFKENFLYYENMILFILIFLLLMIYNMFFKYFSYMNMIVNNFTSFLKFFIMYKFMMYLEWNFFQKFFMLFSNFLKSLFYSNKMIELTFLMIIIIFLIF